MPAGYGGNVVFEVRPMIKRLWCYFAKHRPRRHYNEKSRFSPWTVCGRCNTLMARGYFGWQVADSADKRQFNRAVAKRDADRALQAANPREAGYDPKSFEFPWIDLESRDDPAS